MSKKSDRIRAEIKQTKTDLAQKIEILEGQVRKDVGGAKESLEGAIDKVKATTQFFSLTHQVQQRPLLMTGGAVLSGIVFTRWLVGGSPRAPYREVRESSRVSLARPLVRVVAESYPDEVRILKNMAFSFVVSLIAKQVKAGLPHLVETIGDLERRVKIEFARKNK